MIEFLAPWPPKECSPNARGHWAKKHRAAANYRRHCFFLALAARVDGMRFASVVDVEIEFYPPDKRKRDDDNLIAAFKSGRDGIADALGVNDNRFRVRHSVSPVTERGGLVKIRIADSAAI